MGQSGQLHALAAAEAVDRRWSPDELRMKWEEQRGGCFYCASDLDWRRPVSTHRLAGEIRRRVRGATVDHFVPRSAGGPDNAYNTVLACAPCNAAKGDRPPTLAEVVCFVALRHPDARWLMVLVASMGASGNQGPMAHAFRDALVRLVEPT